MSLLTNIRSFFTPSKVEQRSTVEEHFTDFGDSILFGRLRNTYSAQSLSAVFRCIDLISDSVAMLPIKIENTDKKHKAEIEEHSLNLVFSDGSNVMTRFQFLKCLVTSVLTKGNGYALIERGQYGNVTRLRYLEAGDVTIHYNPRANDPAKRLYYTTTVTNRNIEPINMLHVLKWSKDGVQGMSVLQHAARTLRLAHSSENAAVNVFENNCAASGVLSVDGQLTREQRQQIKARWGEDIANGGIAVLQGNMHYQPVTMNSKDSQLLESRLFQVDEIARFFGINPVLIGDLSHSTYTSIEAAQQEFLVHTLQPFIELIEQEFTRKLFRPSEDGKYVVKFDTTALIKSDRTAVASYYTAMLNNGVYCINEVRQELGLAEIEGGDKHTIAYSKIEDNEINKSKTEEKDEDKEIN